MQHGITKDEHVCRMTEDNRQEKCCRCENDPLKELCSWCVIELQLEKDKLDKALDVIENQLKDKTNTNDKHNSISMKHYETIMRREKLNRVNK